MTFDIYAKSIHYTFYTYLHINVGGALFSLIILLYIYSKESNGNNAKKSIFRAHFSDAK